jgi:hypothetical protein
MVTDCAEETKKVFSGVDGVFSGRNSNNDHTLELESNSSSKKNTLRLNLNRKVLKDRRQASSKGTGY